MKNKTENTHEHTKKEEIVLFIAKNSPNKYLCKFFSLILFLVCQWVDYKCQKTMYVTLSMENIRLNLLI